MKNIRAFTVRNTKLFIRDKATLFFSILSSLILILLYFLFIGKIFIDGISENVPFITEKGAGFIVYLQMMAGVLVLNSMSLSLGMFTGTAKDIESQKLHSFLTTPVKRKELLLSYYIGGVIISFTLNLLTWVVTVIVIGLLTGYWVFVSTLFFAVLILLVSSFISSSIMMLLTVIAKSSTALGIINGISGTFLGFVCGIYMPYSQLGKGVEAVGSFLPFTHLTIWFKNMVLNDAFLQTNITGKIKTELFDNMFTANGVGFCTLNVPLWIMLLLSAVLAIICLIAAGFTLRKWIGKK